MSGNVKLMVTESKISLEKTLHNLKSLENMVSNVGKKKSGGKTLRVAQWLNERKNDGL